MCRNFSDTFCIHQLCCPTCISKAQNVRLIAGDFEPVCELDGRYYQSRQCDFLLRQCWCVTSDGGEIPGTRTRSGSFVFADICVSERQNTEPTELQSGAGLCPLGSTSLTNSPQCQMDSDCPSGFFCSSVAPVCCIKPGSQDTLTCRTNEIVNPCGDLCEPTCDNLRPICPYICNPPACVCAESHVRYYGNCIPRTMCPDSFSGTSGGAGNGLCPDGEFPKDQCRNDKMCGPVMYCYHGICCDIPKCYDGSDAVLPCNSRGHCYNGLACFKGGCCPSLFGTQPPVDTFAMREMCPNGDQPLMNNGRIQLCNTANPCFSGSSCVRSVNSNSYVCCTNTEQILATASPFMQDFCPNGGNMLYNNGIALVCSGGQSCFGDSVCMKSATSNRFICCTQSSSFVGNVRIVSTPVPNTPRTFSSINFCGVTGVEQPYFLPGSVSLQGCNINTDCPSEYYCKMSNVVSQRICCSSANNQTSSMELCPDGWVTTLLNGYSQPCTVYVSNCPSGSSCRFGKNGGSLCCNRIYETVDTLGLNFLEPEILLPECASAQSCEDIYSGKTCSCSLGTRCERLSGSQGLGYCI